MEREHRKKLREDEAALRADHNAIASAVPPSPPSTAGPVGTGDRSSAGVWEANDALMDAMGLAPAGAPTIHRDLADGGATAGSHGAVDLALSHAGRGQSIDGGAQVHVGPVAAAAAAELGAAAFTAGTNIYFGDGHYNPGTAAGDALLRHEQTHVEQTRGLDAPTPGNYQVSSPSDPAEVAARQSEGGDHAHASAAPGTIHRDLLGDVGSAIARATGADKLEEFLNALAAHNLPDAQAKWAAVNGLMRATIRTSSAIMNVLGHYPGGLKADPLESVLDVMGKDGLPILKAVGAAFDRVSYVDAILNDPSHDAAYWFPELKSQGVLDAWLARMPSRAALTEARLTKLGPYMTLASDIADARKLFEQAYPRLRDDAYNAALVKVAPWGVDDAKRMWGSLRGQVPLAHAQTITGGFNLGLQEDLNQDGTWGAAGFGWHHPGPEVIVMPKSSSVTGEGGTGHDMSGGTNSGVVPAGTTADPTVTHWDGTMLHEIGHGVGNKTDGNTFAQTHGDWQGNQGWDAWSQNLFDDAAAAAALPTPSPTPVLPAAEARQFLAKEVAGVSYLPPKWTNRADVVSFINTYYAAQKLVPYWSATKAGTDEYKATANNHNGARTYVWLSRGGLNYTSYKKEVYDSKVSWYSISSTVEWFAEQYTNYYRTNKAAPGADSTTKAKLDSIDAMQATASGGLAAPPSAPAPTPGATPGVATPSATGTGGGEQAAAAPPAGNALSQIRRMNF